MSPLSTLAVLFAEADDAVVVLDGGRSAMDEGPAIAFVNPAMARLAGRTIAELTGRGCLALLDTINDPAAIERLAAALDSDTHLRADVWTRRANGAPCPSRWELLPLRDADGRVLQRVIIVHDLTALRLAEQALTDLKASARRAGHDLNNMITGLIVNLSLLSGPGFPEAQRQGCLSDALDAAREGARTTHSLLDALRRHSWIEGSAAGGDPDDDADDPEMRAADAMGDLDNATPSPRDIDGMLAAGAHPFPSIDGPRGRLLLLDDDEKLLRMMSGFLEQSGYDVSATAEPQECVALYREGLSDPRRFDLVVLDLTIDVGREGQSTLQALQAIDPDVRAIAHSGHAYADAMIAPRAHGFLAAIPKPTPLSALAAIIDTLLRTAPDRSVPRD